MTKPPTTETRKVRILNRVRRSSGCSTSLECQAYAASRLMEMNSSTANEVPSMRCSPKISSSHDSSAIPVPNSTRPIRSSGRGLSP
ncbi:hypothetical protein D3C72_1916130 [compost metagenome]